MLLSFLLVAITTEPCQGLRDAVRVASFDCPAGLDHRAAECASARLFYARRADEPAWLSCDAPLPAGSRLTALLAGVASDGLVAADYEVRASGVAGEVADVARRELALTRALLRYLGDLHEGRVDPGTLRPVVHRHEDTLLAGLEALAEGTRPVAEVQRAVAPRHAELHALWDVLRAGTVSSTVAEVVALNLERWRGQPSPGDGPTVVVNVPSFTARVIRAGATATTVRVIAGRPDRPTPVLAARIVRVVLNPAWSVPRSIALRDILPRVKKDARYLTDQHLHVLTTDGLEVAPGEVDWAALDGLPYRFRQDPGPWNALGRVKLEMPNPHGVLLHDTAAPDLFERSRRALSSGCIRLQHPERVALEVLRDEGWTAERLDAALASGRTAVVALARPVAVQIGYWTAEVVAPDRVVLYPDLYRRDGRLRDALERVSRGRRGAPEPLGEAEDAVMYACELAGSADPGAALTAPR